MDELRRRKIIAPGASVIERLVAAAETLAERQVASQLTRGLLPARKRQLVAAQAARVAILGFQFHGSSSLSRLIG